MKQGNRRYHALFLTGLVLLAVCSTTNGETGRRPSRWTVTAGARYRPVEYELSAEPPVDWETFVVPLESKGSLELYNGVGSMEYQNGWIYRRKSNASGAAYADYRMPFRSTGYGLPRVAESVHSYSNDEALYSPFIRVSLVYGKALGGQLRLWGDYAFANKRMQSSQLACRQQVVQDETVYSFLYDFYQDSATLDFLVYDPVLWGHAGTTPGYPRREVASQQEVVIAKITAIMDSDLNYDLHELTLGVEWSQNFGKRFDLFVAVGPTVNVLDWTFSHETAWTITGQADPAVSMREESDIDLVIGGMAELGGRLSLSDDGRYFCEFSGRYEYLKNLDISAGGGKASITCSYYSGGIGIGVRL